jgi:membrane glycosyltransferase
LLLAAPISILLGKVKVGQMLKKLSLLLVSQEIRDTPLLDDALQSANRTTGHGKLSIFEEAIIDPAINKLHQALARRHYGSARLEVLHMLRSRCLDEGSSGLTIREQSILAQDRESLQWLHQTVWQTDNNSCWFRLLRDARR